MMNTHVRDQLAFLLRASVMDQDNNAGGVTFTNTGFLDLDALTGGAAGAAVAVTLDVPTAGLVYVHVSGNMNNATAGARTMLGYRISGATTTAASDNDCLLYESGAATDAAQMSWASFATCNAGSNTFELQAHVSSGTGALSRTQIGAALI